ncbi:MAG: hypothetical protein P4L27_03020 [Ignavibacteriaceae bacterium]|nr:hypothetical protein [Ignavibacteriaceae bacterium]
MSLILRIDVDSPYGKENVFNHICSRIASDYNITPLLFLPYLKYLDDFIIYLNSKSIQGNFFFRKCTLPTNIILDHLRQGNHIIGLHLENSISLDSFKEELKFLESNINSKIEVFSKHGSGKFKYGLHHFPSYEPTKYLDWGSKLGMKIFFGNLEDPTIDFSITNQRLMFYPAAFWLEHHWRDTKSFDINWLIRESKLRDLVLLIHVENIITNNLLYNELKYILENAELMRT